MERLFKRHFWIVNLIAIGVCAMFAGRAGAHLIEASYLNVDLKNERSRSVPLARSDVAHSKNPLEIVKRNIFCSGCAPIDATTASASDEAKHRDEPQKTTLSLELVSTMLCPGDDTWSVAIIRDMSTKEKDPVMYARHSVLTSGAEVVSVEPHRVYLRNNGQLEYVEMEELPAPHAATSAITPSPSTIDPVLGDLNKSVACSGSACTIERALVDKLLANTMSLATAARFLPSVKDGRPNGFKLYAIRPNSIFDKIGLQNGDTIKAINGNEMTTPDAALGLYSKLRSASHLSAQVDRRGATVTLDYTIR